MALEYIAEMSCRTRTLIYHAKSGTPARYIRKHLHISCKLKLVYSGQCSGNSNICWAVGSEGRDGEGEEGGGGQGATNSPIWGWE